MPLNVQTTLESTDVYTNTTPVGTTVFSVDEIGNVSIGPNKQVQAAPGPYAVGPNGFCDFVYSAKVRSLFAANLRLRMVGDPVDLAIGLAGVPAGQTLHDGTPVGITAGAVIGRIYFQGFQAEGYFNNGSACMYVRAMDTFDQYHQGAQIVFATTPQAAGGGMRDALVIQPSGHTLLNIAYGNDGAPNDAMFPPGLPKAGFPYWDDGHNKFWIRRGSGQWVSVQLS